MRNIVVTTFLSLDGVMENPMWTFPYWNDEIAAFKAEESLAGDTLLLGRVTYEGFAAVWPTSKDQGADYFNGVEKVVVSTTLNKADWNNSRIIRSLEEVQLLKQQSGGDIYIHGSGKLVDSLMKHNLVDRYRLLVYPIVLGKGQRLFEEGVTATLNLCEGRVLNKGVMALIYEPARKR